VKDASVEMSVISGIGQQRNGVAWRTALSKINKSVNEQAMAAGYMTMAGGKSSKKA